MPPTARSLPQLLTEARRWFEDALTTAMQETGATPVSPTQVQLFAVLDEPGTTVSELARRMGVTRQTAHQAVHTLITAGLLEHSPTPGRQRLIRRTPDGERAHQQAEFILQQLESELAARIGRPAVDALRAALEAPWGGPPAVGAGDGRG
ncbi:MarR family winged helix-turn-helix transcriptional regulator [Streptomyces caatingaensis]|uniref:MarR family transcriptional regulator n=1 Tax=Streptomyces caatingaensis TaxID=1678637 RepID=A0A0K9XBM5_9ACTN|nr:MarR family transcriptional regulator [Streptomyces caatingaensis]KNB50810.1 MarR family transcriptional regulator [Streptomyces caatingaensis]